MSNIGNCLTYFLKDRNWKKNYFTLTGISMAFAIVTIVYCAIAAAKTPSPSMVIFIILFGLILIGAYFVFMLVLEGFFAKNTHILATNDRGIRMANVNDVGDLIFVGLKILGGKLVYLIGIAVVIAIISVLTFLFSFLVPALSGALTVLQIVFAIIFPFFIIYLLLQIQCSYSQQLTFSSIFDFSRIGKYKLWKILLLILGSVALKLILSLIFLVIAMFMYMTIFSGANLMQDAYKWAACILDILFIPVDIYLVMFVGSKVMADTIRDTVEEEKRLEEYTENGEFDYYDGTDYNSIGYDGFGNDDTNF